jgi:hypothetical protein
MLQRGLDYAAGTVMICAVCAALLLLAAEILSFSSPVADAAATLGGAVLLNSLRRRLRTMAKHRSGSGRCLLCLRTAECAVRDTCTRWYSSAYSTIGNPETR